MYCAPEIFDGNRYNTGVDVYSYAITLFECVCGSVHTRKQFRSVARVAACSGWRPTPTDNLVETYPLLWALIQESWRPETHAVFGKGLRDLRLPLAKRPTFAEIVQQLTTMKPVSANSDSVKFDVFPQKDDRFFCTKVPIEEWRQALCLETDTQLQARHQTVVAEEIAICQDAGPAWKCFSHRSIPSNVLAEWQSTHRPTMTRRGPHLGYAVGTEEYTGVHTGSVCTGGVSRRAYPKKHMPVQTFFFLPEVLGTFFRSTVVPILFRPTLHVPECTTVAVKILVDVGIRTRLVMFEPYAP